MKAQNHNKMRQWVGRLTVVTLFVTALFSLAAVAGVPVPDIPKAIHSIEGTQCVEKPSFMIRNHMKILFHQRKETVHEGIRTKKHSLKNCFTCHVVKGADGQPVTFKNPKHFCRVCHDYAAVQIDCFQCHTSVPGNDKPLGKMEDEL